MRLGKEKKAKMRLGEEKKVKMRLGKEKKVKMRMGKEKERNEIGKRKDGGKASIPKIKE
jgi:hypothetical protein